MWGVWCVCVCVCVCVWGCGVFGYAVSEGVKCVVFYTLLNVGLYVVCVLMLVYEYSIDAEMVFYLI